ncbi:MAG: phosphatase PAP2 family protein [Patescibacteria group bacterium]
MDTSLFYFFNGLAIKFPALDFLFAFLANNFGLVVIVALGYFLLIHKEKKRGTQELVMMLAVAGLAWTVGHFLKDIFNTARPFVSLSDAIQLIPHEADGAFPSGHATFYSALAMMMWFYHKRIALGLGLVALIVGVSRVITGVHWPVDILGGFMLGVVIAMGTYFFIKNFSGK